MPALFHNTDGSYTVLPGSDITLTIAEAIDIAKANDSEVEFVFANILVRVTAKSDKFFAYAKWRRKHDKFCTPPFTEEELDDPPIQSQQ